MEENNTQEASVQPMEEKKGANPLIIIVILIILGLGVYAVVSGRGKPAESSVMEVPTPEGAQVMEEKADTATESMSMESGEEAVKEFTIEGSNYKFSPNQMTVNKGDTVKITLKVTEGTHNLVVEGYDVSTKIIGSGSQETLTFVADEVGSFEFYCSVANHRALGMTGTLVVQ